jgi:beta-alanine degradation protein BauB
MRRFCLTLGVLALCCLGVATARAQDPVQVAPNNFTVLLENDEVRVLDFHSKGGEKIPMHSHPAYVTYDISGTGATRFTSPDGKTTESENKAGRTAWHQPATHASEATAPVHALLVELKAKPAKKP